MKTPIVLLGPLGGTFSEKGYERLADIFGAPKIGSLLTKTHLVISNFDILPELVSLGGGFGVIAMETEAGGVITENLSFFNTLLSLSVKQRLLVKVKGAFRMPLNFALMARQGVSLDDVKGICAHPKALQACQRNIERHNWVLKKATSNGKAVEMIAKLDEYASYVALGPGSAAEQYGLRIINPAFEDAKAKTTFFLLAPSTEDIADLRSMNRAVIVFRLKRGPGTLRNALGPFDDHDISLNFIHSAHIGKGNYDFLVTADLKKDQIDDFENVICEMPEVTEQHFVSGPFPLV